MICACENEFLYFEKLAKEQTRVFPMVRDVGYVYSPEEIPKIKKALKELRDTYNHTHEVYGDEQHGGWKVSMFIGFEKDGDHYNGVRLVINGVHSTKIAPPEEIKFITIAIYQDTNVNSGYKK